MSSLLRIVIIPSFLPYLIVSYRAVLRGMLPLILQMAVARVSIL